MPIAFVFGESVDKDLGNLKGPYDALLLDGPLLKTKDGLVLAELVEDDEDRLYWKPFEGNSLRREISMYGFGRLP